jgi:Flp pilus assembly protein TadD
VPPKIFVAWILGLILLAGALFAAGYSNPFVLDAVNKIELNPDVRSSQFRWQSFFDAYSSDQAKGSHLRNDPSRPVTYFVYWALWQADNGQPWPFHLFALTIHLLSALLFGLIILRVNGGMIAAIEASALFLVLPLNIGVVFYPFALSDVLAGCFTLLILYLSLRPPTLARDVIAAVAFALACGAKQSAVIIPALVFVLNRRDWRMLILTSSLAALYLVLRFVQFGRLGDLEAINTFPPQDYFLAQGVMIFKYLKLLLLPSGFSLDHWVRVNDFALWIKLLAWAAIAFFTVASLRHFRSGWNWLAVGWLLFLIPLLPVSSFLPTTDLFVERRAYLSSAGFLLMFAGGILRQNTRATAWLAAVWVAMYAYNSFERVHLYHSAENIYQEALQLYPNDARNLNNLATLYLRAGRFDEAFEKLNATLVVNPQNIEAISNLAALYQMQNPRQDLAKAEVLYLQALQLDSNHVNAYQNLGFLKLTQGQFLQAKTYFEKGLQLSPHSAILLLGMGKVEESQHNTLKARQYYQSALQEEPNDPNILRALRDLK